LHPEFKTAAWRAFCLGCRLAAHNDEIADKKRRGVRLLPELKTTTQVRNEPEPAGDTANTR
jgi:hypothetical protein